MLVPLEAARAETRAGNSRFLAILEPVERVEDARAFIALCRAQFPDASHHVPAFIIGGGNSVTEFCSDDGEPNGTSGRPLLAVLKGSGLGNIAVVVVRWFGGTLLGTGGLVKAYSEAGKALLQQVRTAELVAGMRVSCRLPYHVYEKAKAAFINSGWDNLREHFEEEVLVEADVPQTSCAELEHRLSDIGSGKLALHFIGPVTMRRPLSG